MEDRPSNIKQSTCIRMEQKNRNEINQEISNGFLLLKGQGVGLVKIMVKMPGVLKKSTTWLTYPLRSIPPSANCFLPNKQQICARLNNQQSATTCQPNAP